MQQKLKKIRVIGSILLALALFAIQIVNPVIAKAGENAFSISSARMNVYGGTIVPGFVNSTNKSFTMELSSINVGEPTSIELLVDHLPLKTAILATATTDNNYIFSSSTIDNASLQLVLTENSLLNPVHSFQAKADFANGDTIIVDIPAIQIVADYHSPVATASYETVESAPVGDGWLKSGDEISFKISAKDNLTKDGQLIANGSLLTNKLIFNYSSGLDEYMASYKIKDGDGVVKSPISAESLSVTDEAGNVLQIADLGLAGLSIDGSSPSYVVNSPKSDKIYNNEIIPLNYSVSKGTTLTSINLVDSNLNKSQLDVSAGSLGGLVDGKYSLQMTFSSIGGNLKTEIINFSVDKTAPFIGLSTSVNGREFSTQDSLNIKGSSEGHANIGLSFSADGAFVGQTVSSQSGEWQIDFDFSKINPGNYGLWITSRDEAGNSSNLYIGDIKVSNPVTSTTQTVTLAYTGTQATKTGGQTSDVSPKVVEVAQENIDNADVASQGSTLSSNDERGNLINWSMWLLTLAVVVLISAFGTAGYYGYGLISARSSAGSGGAVSKPIKKMVIPEKPKVSNPESTLKDDQPGEKPYARW